MFTKNEDSAKKVFIGGQNEYNNDIVKNLSKG